MKHEVFLQGSHEDRIHHIFDVCEITDLLSVREIGHLTSPQTIDHVGQEPRGSFADTIGAEETKRNERQAEAARKRSSDE